MLLIKNATKTYLDKLNIFYRSALLEASYNGNSEIAIALIQAGASLDIKDYSGNTALIYGMEFNFENFEKDYLLCK